VTTVFNFTFLSQVSLLSFLFFSFLFASSLFTFVVDFAFQHLAGFSPSLGRVLVLTLTVWLTLSAPFFPYLHAHATHFGTRFCAHPLSVMPCQHNLMCYSVLFFCACVCVCVCVCESEWVLSTWQLKCVIRHSYLPPDIRNPQTLACASSFAEL